MPKVTYTYDYETPIYDENRERDYDAEIDAESAFNERAWSTLAAIAGGADQLEWDWSGLEVGGLRVNVVTTEAADRLTAAGYTVSD